MSKAVLTSMSGATVVGDSTEFRVWAPRPEAVVVQLEEGATFSMQSSRDGNFALGIPVRAGNRYFYVPDGARCVPDPVSRLLPEGVHGPTEIVDPSVFRWHDSEWRGLDLSEYIIYELHVGTFTPGGTFEGVIERLGYLKRLGITAIELMPVAAFPGKRNWGYDGVSPYAVQASYGGPEGLKRLVDAAHRSGLAVVLDVVYNHLGNEGNYLRLFGPYYTNRHKTPWGNAINFDGRGCEGVRQYFIENALYWVREYHMDGLRLDAIQTIYDDSPRHIVAEISDRVHQLGNELGRKVCVIAETDKNEAKLVKRKSTGGFGLDAVWSDDFHHAIHAVLTGEHEGYYQDFGTKEQIVRALNDGFVFQGEHFKFWGTSRGTSPAGVPLPAHVICIQNHDQVGNRAKGERLGHIVPRGGQKLASTLLLLAPHTPLIFMGEEYSETAHFQFFTDFADPVLQKAVSDGRRREFKDFSWEEVPDPQDPATFDRSKLHWGRAEDGNDMLEWYRELIRLRKSVVMQSERTCKAELHGDAIWMQVPADQPKLLVVVAFGGDSAAKVHPEGWRGALSSNDDGFSVRVFTR